MNKHEQQLQSMVDDWQWKRMPHIKDKPTRFRLTRHSYYVTGDPSRSVTYRTVEIKRWYGWRWLLCDGGWTSRRAHPKIGTYVSSSNEALRVRIAQQYRISNENVLLEGDLL